MKERNKSKSCVDIAFIIKSPFAYGKHTIWINSNFFHQNYKGILCICNGKEIHHSIDLVEQKPIYFKFLRSLTFITNIFFSYCLLGNTNWVRASKENDDCFNNGSGNASLHLQLPTIVGGSLQPNPRNDDFWKFYPSHQGDSAIIGMSLLVEVK